MVTKGLNIFIGMLARAVSVTLLIGASAISHDAVASDNQEKKLKWALTERECMGTVQTNADWVEQAEWIKKPENLRHFKKEMTKKGHDSAEIKKIIRAMELCAKE